MTAYENPNRGLSKEEAASRLLEFGPNELSAENPRSVWHIVADVIREPMFLLLLACAVIYMVLGDYTEGLILLSSVLVIIFITFYQHRKSERALEALRRLSSPRALVIRDGEEIRIPGREVVPGDLLRLSEGDRVPADGRLLETRHLMVDESMLTGESAPVLKKPAMNQQPADTLYSGTLTVQGHGLMEVRATGLQTAFGKIGLSMQQIGSEPTRLAKEMKILIRRLLLAGILLSGLVTVAFYFSRGELLPSLLNGLASAMAILPEEFPVVLTVFLSIGVWRLSKHQVLTRTPAAIETLGSASVLCSDKTGTITQNRMALVSVATHQGTVSLREEAHRMGADAEQVLQTARMACSDNSTDPMDRAIIRDFNSSENSRDWSTGIVLYEFPLSHELPAMTRLLKSKDGHVFSFTKGSPEAVLDLCQVSEEKRRQVLQQTETLSRQGQRVLGVARGPWPGAPVPASQHDLHPEWLGLIGFEDPVRPEVPASVAECHAAGIRVLMITGDYPSTAISIAKQAGLNTLGGVLTGEEINTMSDETLQKKIRQLQVCARILPGQKLRIIRALQAGGDVVAMTGDGVNDAPALKAADIGIAMGAKGTDVAREAADLVLLDDHFRSIAGAIRSGRRIYDNLQKAMSYIIAIHIPIIGLTLLPAFFPSLPVLLMPMHIVFMELIIDPVCSLAFESEPEEDRIMQRPPRDSHARFFGLRNLLGSSMKGFMLLGMVMAVYFLSIHEGHSDKEIRAIAFSSLIIGNLFLILHTISNTRFFPSALLSGNRALLFIFILASGMLLALLLVPALRTVFGMGFPGFAHFGISLGAAFALLLLLEAGKWVQLQARK